MDASALCLEFLPELTSLAHLRAALTQGLGLERTCAVGA